MKPSLLLLFCLMLNSFAVSAQSSVPLAVLNYAVSASAQQTIIADTLSKKLHVKMVTEHDNLNGDTSSGCIEIYNMDGKISEQITKPSISVQIHDFYYYNSAGQLIKKRQLFIQNNDTTVYNKDYSTDTSQTKKDKKKKDKGETDKYDSKKRLTERDVRRNSYLNKYFYDTEERLITAEIYNNDSIQARVVITYNAKGQLLKQISYSYEAGAESEYDITPFYDNRGLVTKITKNDVITPPGETPQNEVDTFEYTFY